jgi:aminoglycoside phosphotransferase (APT) family kinase protein
MEVDQFERAPLFAREPLERLPYLGSDDVAFSLLIRPVATCHFERTIERWQLRCASTAAPEFVDAEVARYREDPAADGGLRLIILGRVTPNADERFLDRLLGIAFRAEDAQAERKALAVVAVVERAEGGLAAIGNGLDKVDVLGKPVIAHWPSAAMYATQASADHPRRLPFRADVVPNSQMVPNPAAFENWLRRAPGFERAAVVAIAPVDGGASNITCRVELGGVESPAVCLRVQRERGIFEPYDVIREGEVLRALSGGSVPVPRLVESEPDARPLGAPFIVMEWIDAPHMGVAPDADFGEYTAAVAAIHKTDWRDLGLGFLGIPVGPKAALAGELDAVAARMPGFGCADDPVLNPALARLRAAIPGDGSLALCQGDINVFNYLFRGGRVVGVVDWEQARISDPRSDVGQLVALSHLKSAPFGPADQQSFVRAYGAASGARLRGMEFFRAFWLFQLGVIYHGWRSFNESEPWYAWERLVELLEPSLAELS